MARANNSSCLKQCISTESLHLWPGPVRFIYEVDKGDVKLLNSYIME